MYQNHIALEVTKTDPVQDMKQSQEILRRIARDRNCQLWCPVVMNRGLYMSFARLARGTLYLSLVGRNQVQSETLQCFHRAPRRQEF